MDGRKNKLKGIKFKIKKFGAITDSTLHLDNFIIFSGESGLGKSYAALLCNYIFYLLVSPTRLNDFFKEKNLKFNDIRTNLKNEGQIFIIKKFDVESWMSKDITSYMAYMLNDSNFLADVSFELPFGDTFNFTYAEEVRGLASKEDSYLRLSVGNSNSHNTLSSVVKNEDESIEGESCFSFLFRYYLILLIFGKYDSYDYDYILPPSRGPVLSEDITPKSGQYKEYIKSLLDITSASYKSEYDNKTLLEEIKNILEGKVYKDNNNTYMYESAGNNIPISAAASSIREIAPLALLIGKHDVSKSCILIEEPEAHLHPLKQREMADVLSLLYSNGACLQITTHSDYLLRRLNELINLYKLSNIKEEDDFKKICSHLNMNPDLKIDYKNIGAYLLKRREDGSVEIEEQDLEEGIPFSSFYKALKQNIDNSNELESYLNGEDD